jgi:hypothetical protein
MGTTAVGVGIPSYSSTAVVQTPKADSLFIAGLATMLAIGIPATAKTAPEFMKTEEYPSASHPSLVEPAQNLL